MRRLLLPALALVALLAGCASAGPQPSQDASPPPRPAASESPDPEPAPRFVGPADDGAVYALAVDATTTLRLPAGDETEPELEGAAVLLIPVVSVAGDGAREWEIRGAEPGTAVVRDPGADGWAVTFVVG